MTSTPLAVSLLRPRFEIIPLKGVEEQLAHLPREAVVTVTASPTKGMEATLELTERVAALGQRAVPHLSARMFTGRDQLESVLARLVASGIREVFVVAGDLAEPQGPYEGAAELLEEMDGLGVRFDRVGITGYPEGHAFIPDRTTIEAMTRKVPYATHIVSQICYDPELIRGWIHALRARGVQLPIFIGLPGVVDRARLLRVSMRVGLGDSVRFLSKQGEVATRMLSGYRPDELIDSLSDLVDDPRHGVAGWHLFTFNEVERTERWRRQMLATTQGAAL